MHHQNFLYFPPVSSAYLVSFSSRAFRFSGFELTTPPTSELYLGLFQKSMMEPFLEKQKPFMSLALSL